MKRLCSYCRNGSYNRVTCINYQSNAYFFLGKKHRERNDVSAQNRGDSLLRISLDDILKGQKHKCFNTFPHVKKMNTAFILHRNGGYFTDGEAKKRILTALETQSYHCLEAEEYKCYELLETFLSCFTAEK